MSIHKIFVKIFLKLFSGFKFCFIFTSYFLHNMTLLKPTFYGDIMELLVPVKSNDYFLEQVDVDMFTGKRRYYNIIDGHAKVYGYLPGGTTEENLKPSKIITAILLILFVSGFFATVLGLPKAAILPIVILYAIILTALVGSMFSAVILNNLRIRKIRKKLGLTVWQYNLLADFYLE